jgi:hypothetical protein
MKCDSRASLLAHTFTNLCLDREPKVKVVTINLLEVEVQMIKMIFWGKNQPKSPHYEKRNSKVVMFR